MAFADLRTNRPLENTTFSLKEPRAPQPEGASYSLNNDGVVERYLEYRSARPEQLAALSATLNSLNIAYTQDGDRLRINQPEFGKVVAAGGRFNGSVHYEQAPSRVAG